MRESATNRAWVFTWNNYTPQDLETLRELKDEEKVVYLIFGFEVGEKGTPHLQGYAKFNSAVRLTGAKKLLDKKAGAKSRIHVEARKAEDENDAIDYCKKGGQSHDEWKALGTRGSSFGVGAQFEIIKDARKRTKPKKEKSTTGGGLLGLEKEKKPSKDELEQECVDYIYMRRGKATMEEIMERNAPIALHAMQGIQWCINSAKKQAGIDQLRKQYAKLKLYPWQKSLLRELRGKPHDRRIIWYVDEVGNQGKSTFSRKLSADMGALILNNGRTCDLAYAWSGENVVIFDMSRTSSEVTNYDIMEQIKTGSVLSTKYTVNRKEYAAPHVVVMANWEPNYKAMSADRWHIRYLKDKRVVKCAMVKTFKNGGSKLKEIPPPDDQDVELSDDEVITVDGEDGPITIKKSEYECWEGYEPIEPDSEEPEVAEEAENNSEEEISGVTLGTTKMPPAERSKKRPDNIEVYNIEEYCYTDEEEESELVDDVNNDGGA